MKDPMVLYSSSKAFSCKFMRDWESCSHCPAAVSDKGAKKLLDSSCIRIFWRETFCYFPGPLDPKCLTKNRELSPFLLYRRR